MSAAAYGIAPNPSSRESDAAIVYHTIRSRETETSRADPFLAHVYACAFAISVEEAHSNGLSVGQSAGLDRAALEAMIASWLPAASRFASLDAQPSIIERDEEETQLRELLVRFQVDDSIQTQWIVSIVTRRAMAPNHLWQDLGLRDRVELCVLIKRFFPRLAAANVGNMKWKKFFFRQICSLDGFSLCAAPTCGECADVHACFGEETGKSALFGL